MRKSQIKSLYRYIILSLLLILIKSEEIQLLSTDAQVGQSTTYFVQFLNFDTWNNNANTPPFSLTLKAYFGSEFDQGKSKINIEKETGKEDIDYLIVGSQYSFLCTVVIKSYTTTLKLNNFINPSYSGTYTIKFELSDTKLLKSFTKQIQIYSIKSSNQLQLSFNNDQQTNSYGILNLLVNPSILLPSDVAIKVQIPTYSSLKPSMSFISNPVECRQKQKQSGDPTIKCSINSSNELIITSIISSKQTIISQIQLEILNVLTPVSTQPVSGFNVVLFGQNSGTNIQEESGKSLSVSIVSKPKSFTIDSSSQVTLTTANLTINMKANTFFSSQFAITFQFPTDFPISSFKDQLKGFTQDGRAVTLSVQSNNVILIQSDITVTGDDSKIYLRLEGVKNYQGAYQTQTYYQTVIYSDSSLTYKVYEDLSSIQYQTTVNSLNINSFNFNPDKVQVTSAYFLDFDMPNLLDGSDMSQNRLSITIPSSLSFGDQMKSSMLGKGKGNCSSLTDYLEFVGTSSSAICEMEKDSLIRVYGFYDKQNRVAMRIKQIINPFSTDRTQPFLIQVEVQQNSNTNWLMVYQNIQSEDRTTVKATSGEIQLLRFESTGSLITFDTSAYLISFTLTSKLIPSSFIIISFPTDDFFFSYMSQSTFSCEFSSGLLGAKTSCAFDQANKIEIGLQADQILSAGSKVTVLFNGVRNPRSTRPTKQLKIVAQSPTRGVVDEIKVDSEKGSVRMSVSNTLSIVSVQPSSFLIGDTTMYTITLSSPVHILDGDKMIINLQELIQSSSVLQCSGIQGLPASIQCTKDNNNLIIKITVLIAANSVIQFTVTSLKNPYSNVISAPLLFQIKDSEDYLIAQASFSDVAKRGSSTGFDPVIFQQMEIIPDSLKVGKVTTFRLKFTLPIPVSQSQAIIVSLPSEIGLSDDPLGCFFLLKGIASNARAICQYQNANHSIQITNILPIQTRRILSGYGNDTTEITPLIEGEKYERMLGTDITEIPINTEVTLSLTGIKNKLTNGPFKSDESSKFKLAVCNVDSSAKYIELASSTFNLPPSFVCSSPCSNCYGTDTSCTTCTSSNILLPELNTCKNECPSLYARIQQSSKYNQAVCMRCLAQDKDINCSSCDPSNLSICTSCLNKFKLVIDENDISRCEEITSENDPIRIFVYDLEFNLPYICVYIICISVYIIVRKIFQIKNLNLTIVLLSAYALIETIVLIAFVVKVALLEKFLPILLAAILLIFYIILQSVFAHRFKKALRTDAGYNLYEPNYKTIRVIAYISLYLNFKVFLMYRSFFSFIKDIYYIPFGNPEQLSYTIKRGLQLCLAFTFALMAFILWAMYYSYNFRNVTIPPFFFIEYALLQFLILILLLFLLVPNQRFHVDKLFDILSEQSYQYKDKQLDLKSLPLTMTQTRLQQTYDQPHQFQAHSIYITANNFPSSTSSNAQQIGVSKVLLPRSSNNINSQVNIRAGAGNNQEFAQRQQGYKRNDSRSKTQTQLLNNNNSHNKLFQNKISKSTQNEQQNNQFSSITQNGAHQNSVVVTPINHSINHDISPSNFNSAQELQVQERFLTPMQVSPMNPNKQQQDYTTTNLSQNMIEGQNQQMNNSSDSNGASDIEIRSRNNTSNSNTNININRHNHHMQSYQQQQIGKSNSYEMTQEQLEQMNTGNFEKQSSSYQSQQTGQLITPGKKRNSTSSSLSPNNKSNSKLKQDGEGIQVVGKKLISSMNTQQIKQKSEHKLTHSANDAGFRSTNPISNRDDGELDENQVEVEIDDQNRTNLQNKMYISKQHKNNFTNKEQLSQSTNKQQQYINNTNIGNSTHKYTESSEEVEESHCQNAQKNALTKQNFALNSQRFGASTKNQQHQFLSPRDPQFGKIFTNNLILSNDQSNSSQQGTPYIGNSQVNNHIDFQNNSNQDQNNLQPNVYTFSKQQERQFQIQVANNHQTESSPINVDKTQVFDTSKCQPPSFSRALNASNGKQLSSNQHQLYSFSNSRFAQPTSCIVSKFDQFSNENNSQPRSSPSKRQANNSSDNSQPKNFFPMTTQPFSNKPLSTKSNIQQNGERKNNLFTDILLNPNSSINIKQSTDSKASEYFPS